MSKTKKILIISGNDDSHTQAVVWGLRQLGHNPTIFDRSKFPSEVSAAWSQNRPPVVSLTDPHGEIHVSPFDVIWCRRLSPLPTPRESSHPDDWEIINRESTIFLDSIIPYLSHKDTFWVNPYFSSRIAERKIPQLVAADRIGFKVPDTLIGNDHDSILEFFNKHRGKIIYKPHSPGGWGNDDGSSIIIGTSKVLEEHLSDRESILACPGIYQELIEKKCEYRVTVMGNQVFAGIIDSQADGESIDWRFDSAIGRPPYIVTTLPEEISNLCISYCKEMNLQFACIDLIHGTNDEIVFLEANQAGQFLWIEECDAQTTMLDKFCRFLSGSDSDHGAESTPINFADFRDSMEAPGATA